MTKRIMSVLAVVAAISACTTEDENPAPKRDDENDGTGSTTSGLSESFGRECARCHGPRGEGTFQYPRLPGNNDEFAFIAVVRAGRSEMPAFPASSISDEDLKADFLWMTNER